MTVVDASVVVRLLQNRQEDRPLRERFRREQRVSAPALIDAEVASAVRGLLLSSKVRSRLTVERADQMLLAFAALPLDRFPMQPFQRRVLEMRHNLTAYDGFYVALAESMQVPLLTSDRKMVGVAGHAAVVEHWA
jgi:predicted nucleic acid-binding protein